MSLSRIRSVGWNPNIFLRLRRAPAVHCPEKSSRQWGTYLKRTKKEKAEAQLEKSRTVRIGSPTKTPSIKPKSHKFCTHPGQDFERFKRTISLGVVISYLITKNAVFWAWPPLNSVRRNISSIIGDFSHNGTAFTQPSKACLTRYTRNQDGDSHRGLPPEEPCCSGLGWPNHRGDEQPLAWVFALSPARLVSSRHCKPPSCTGMIRCWRLDAAPRVNTGECLAFYPCLMLHDTKPLVSSG
jgi:hypothetical protein